MDTNTNAMIYRATAAHHLDPYFTAHSISQWILTGESALLVAKEGKPVRLNTLSASDIIKAVEETKANMTPSEELKSCAMEVKASSNRGTDPKWVAR